MDEAPGSIIAELAVMYSGAAFAPLDPGAPVARLRFQLEDCKACTLIHTRTQSALVQMLLSDDATCGIQAVEFETSLDTARQRHVSYTQQQSEALHGAALRANDACHVIYTSGSSGSPKGVVCEHGALAHYANAKLLAHGIDSGSRVLLVSAATWDPSIGDAFSTFACGATLVTAPRARLVQDLRAVLIEGSVSHVCSTPALWRMLPKESAGWDSFPALRVIALGGERLPSSLVHQWRAPVGHLPCAETRRRLLNTYGVTEATVYQTVGECRPGDRAGMVGSPLPGVVCAVAASPGDVGEIYIGGPLVARGYVGADDLTAEKFITIPDCIVDESGAPADSHGHAYNDFRKWLSAGRWFKTGDLGRWYGATAAVVDGNDITGNDSVAETDRPELQLLGRIDDQIKLRGMRIEPGEVQSALTVYPLVSQAAVVAYADQTRDEVRLVAYVVLSDGVPIEAWHSGGAEAAVRVHCQRQLPVHSRPSQFVCLEKLPLTSSGKLDRQALIQRYPPAPLLRPRSTAEPADVARSQTHPPSAIEKVVLVAWSHALGIAEENLSVSDDFFALGGTSVSAREMIQRLPRKVVPCPASDSGGRPKSDSVTETDWSDGAPNTIRYCALYRKSRLVDYAAALEWLDCALSTAGELDAEQMLREMEVALPTLNDETSALNAALKLAARSGCDMIIHTLLDANADVDGGHTKKNRGDAPLLLAAQAGHQRAVEALALAGANPNLPDASSRTAVHMAAARGHVHVLRWLLQEGAAWTAKDVNKWTPHHFAAWHGHTAVLDVLLRHQAWQILSMAHELQARASGRCTEVELLQTLTTSRQNEVPASPGTRIERQHFEHAAESDLIEKVAAAVLEAEESLGPITCWAAGPIATGIVYQHNRTRRDWSFALNGGHARDRWQRTPLSWAIAHNHVSAVRLLLSVGASLEWINPYPRNRRSKTQPWTTSLHLAVLAAATPGRSSSDGLVLEQRLGSSGTCGKTWKRRNRVVGEIERPELSRDPLEIANWEPGPEKDRFAVLRVLLELPQVSTRQINSVDHEGRTALHEAASLKLLGLADRRDCADDQPPQPPESDALISSPDGAFSAAWQCEQAHRVAEEGCSNDDGSTKQQKLIMRSGVIRPGSTIAVRLLLDAHAAATVVDRSGHTALQVALQAGQTEVAALLERAVNIDSATAC